MVILGLLLIVAGILAILAALFATDPASVSYLGLDLDAVTLFFIGVGAGAAILWGFGILKYGTKRGMQARRERRELDELNRKLKAAEADRRAEGHTDDGGDKA